MQNSCKIRPCGLEIDMKNSGKFHYRTQSLKNCSMMALFIKAYKVSARKFHRIYVL